MAAFRSATSSLVDEDDPLEVETGVLAAAAAADLGSDVAAGCGAGVGAGVALTGEAERAGVDAATGAGAAADLVGLAGLAAAAGAGAGVATAAPAVVGTLPLLLTPLPVSKLSMFRGALLPLKNSAAVNAG